MIDLNERQREDLTEQFVELVVDNMSEKDLVRYAIEQLTSYYNEGSIEDISVNDTLKVEVIDSRIKYMSKNITKRSIECGAKGSRLTGGGFGGFTVSLIEKKDYEQWYKKMTKYYSNDKFLMCNGTL